MLMSLYFLKFATDVLHVAPAAMGLLLGAGRLWDAFSDPLAGFLFLLSCHNLTMIVDSSSTGAFPSAAALHSFSSACDARRQPFVSKGKPCWIR